MNSEKVISVAFRIFLGLIPLGALFVSFALCVHAFAQEHWLVATGISVFVVGVIGSLGALVGLTIADMWRD